MKILLCHNYYQHPGGEDLSFADEARLLENHGHEVVRWTVHNDAITHMSRTSVARRTLWNRQTYTEVRQLIRREKPYLMHCTNSFPLLSPAAYYAARREGVAVVQALRNYRLLCPNAQFLRDGRVCEDCLGKAVPWPGVVHGCYRDSRTASSVVATMLVAHRLLGTWRRKIDLYFTLTDFSRRKFIEAGWEGERIVVKPNFIDPDPGPGQGRGGYAVFVGRLSAEKGITSLLEAWRRLHKPLRLKIVGDGPMAQEVRSAAAADSRIEWLGRRTASEVLELVGDAAFLVMPSIWYETFGRTIIEAFARGTPVLAARLGAMAELVEEDRTGLLFRPGDAADLAAAVERMAADPNRLARWRREARCEYEAKYTAAINYRQLLAIYEQALNLSRRTKPALSVVASGKTGTACSPCAAEVRTHTMK